MSKAYRIVEKKHPHCPTYYCVERKSIFGFWYNPLNIDGDITGEYLTFHEAKEAVEREKGVTTTKIVYP